VSSDSSEPPTGSPHRLQGEPRPRTAHLLVSCRPEYQHGWVGKGYYRQIQLDPLSPDAVEDLLRRLLGDDPSLRPLKHVVSDQTEGNPLFVEECVRSLIETGVLAYTGDCLDAIMRS
jgi:predicted ATPase